MILNCGEERRILPRRQKKKKLGLAIFGVNFVCHNCRVLLTSSGQMQDCCLNILKSIARLPTTQMSIAPRLRNSGLDLYLGRVTKFSVSQADFLLVAIFHVLLLFFSSCCVLQVDKNKFRRQYTANFPKNSPNLTNYEKILIFKFHLINSACSTRTQQLGLCFFSILIMHIPLNFLQIVLVFLNLKS